MTQQTTHIAETPVDAALPPVPARPSGLEIFDLKVTATPVSITWDKTALNAALDAVLAEYQDINVTEGNIPAIKTEMAGLNKLKERLDTARKDIARRIKRPVDAFETDIKAMLARITDVRGALDTQVKELERRDRESRRAAVQLMIDAVKDTAGLPDLDIPVNDRWLNKSARASTVQAEIENEILKARRERDQAALVERAREDRVTLVHEAVRSAAAQHGVELPMGRFADCLSLDMPVPEVMARIKEAFAAAVEAHDIEPPPLRAQVSDMPTAAPEAAPTSEASGFSTAGADEDAFAMPTFPAAESPATLPKGVRSLTVTLTYDEELEPDVLHLLDRLRDVAGVEIC